MNPITENRYLLIRYALLYGLFAACYAVVFGLWAAVPAGYIVLDWAVFGLVSGFEGLLLWNVLRYGAEGIRVPILRVPYHVATATLFAAVAVGVETATLYLAEMPLSQFATTIPARVLLTVVVYVCFALWYWSVGHSDSAKAAEEARYAEKSAPDPVESLERVTVKGAGGKIEVIGVGEIVYLQAEGDYVAIVTSAGRWLKEGTMKYFEEALPRDKFVRVHRSYIVAVSHISRIETSGRDHTLVLRGRIGGGGIGGVGGGSGSGGDGGGRSRSPHGNSIRISDAGYRLLKQTLGL